MSDKIEYACRFSPFLNRLQQSGLLDPDIFLPMLERPLGEQDLRDFADWQQLTENEDEAELARQLRILRRYVVSHIIVRDLNHIGSLDEVTGTITRFADFAVNTAVDFAHRYYTALYGTPIGRYSREPQFLSIVAMGKAGGYELNVSSDIDLIFVYPENGDTDGRRERSNQEFFTKVGQKTISLLNDITADGQVFRVDMRLRPDGDSGPLVVSEAALEQYLVKQGREWERYAWCKGRVITPYPNDIAALVRPFVFRKYLDFNVYEAMRGLHKQIRREVSKQGMADNIKLGAGGIREVEFIAQIFQMIRGGRLKSLQLKGTQETLSQLAAEGILESEESRRLLAAYRFLRDVEHRLQYWEDQQTQVLPDNPEQRQKLAESMGFTDYAAFTDGLNTHRREIERVFNGILSTPEHKTDSPEQQRFAALWQENGDEAAQAALLEPLGFDSAGVLQRLDSLRHSPKYRQLGQNALARFDAVVPQCIAAAAECPRPTQALFRLLDFLETVSRRSSYLAFLHEYPQELQRVADITCQSAWVADYLQKHPILLDELLNKQLMDTEHDWAQFAASLSAAMQHSEDTESRMDVLRHTQHAQVFRLAVQDLAGLWPKVEALSDQLSLLADTVLAEALHYAWQDMPRKHTDTPQFAVIGYGKLGGKEMSYTSDLDLVFLFDDPHPDAADTYNRLARRLTTWLSGSTGAGMLYDVDLRLRPNGDSGFLTHSLTAFEKYQHENAWTWEHQSLTRARFICGSPEIGRQFERIRRDILSMERDDNGLRSDILSMRQKMLASHPPVEAQVKHARGGIIDVEFIVQYLILSQSHHCPELLENYGNIALLKMAAERGLIDAETARLTRRAYRHYRKQQHRNKLYDGETTLVDDTLLAHYAAVKRLWQAVFGETAQ